MEFKRNNIFSITISLTFNSMANFSRFGGVGLLKQLFTANDSHFEATLREGHAREERERG